jgi:outer membrane cobalamin receptor
VQVFTRPGSGPLHAELSGRGGGFGTFDAEGAVRGASSAVTYSLGAAKHSTDGTQLFNSGYSNGVGSGMVGVARGPLDARISLRYSDAVLHFPTDGSGQVVDSNAVDRRDRLAVGLDAGGRVLPGAELRLIFNSYDTHGVVDNQPNGPPAVGRYYYTTADRTRRRSGELRAAIDLPASARLTVGAQVERQWQASATQSNFGDNAFTATRRTTGTYAQLLFTPADRHTITLGGRYEHNEQFGNFVTWRSAGSFRVAEGTRVRASVGTAFREPTFLENFGGAYVIGNPQLSPEHALSADLGVEHDVADWMTLGATYFASSFRDLIDYKYSATEPNYFNLARTRTGGAELEARVHAPSGFYGDAAFTYLQTRVVDPGTSTASTALFAPGGHLLRRPMHTLDAGAGYRMGRGDFTVRALRVGTREDNYFAPDFSTQHVTLPAYTRIDLSGEIVLAGMAAGPGRPTASATWRVENVFDALYTDVAGFNYDFSRTDEASLRQTGYRAPGRRVLVGLRLSY